MAQVDGVVRFKNNPIKVFYTGSTINIIFDIILTNFIDIHGIKLIISGKANVFLTDVAENTNKNNEKKTECVRYMGKENFFETNTYIFGSSDGSNYLEEGFHTYEYSYDLPNELPSSVEGHFGRIRYYAKAVIEFNTPNKSPEAFTTHFIVHKVTDLNYDQPMLRLPSISEIQETFLCWPCRSKPICIQCRIPQSGYVCGQYIPVTLNIINNSDKFLNEILTTLHLIMIYNSEMPFRKTKTEEFIIQKSQITLVTNKIKETLNIEIEIPPTPPTCLENICRVIQVLYEIRVRAFLKDSGTKLVISQPIVIGNIPLRKLNNDHMTISKNAYYKPKDPDDFAKNINLDSPTLKEACYMRSKKLPEYPVYNFSSGSLYY